MDVFMLRAVLLDPNPNFLRPGALEEMARDCRHGARLMFRLHRSDGGQALLNLARCLDVLQIYERERLARLQAVNADDSPRLQETAEAAASGLAHHGSWGTQKAA